MLYQFPLVQLVMEPTEARPPLAVAQIATLTMGSQIASLAAINVQPALDRA